MSSQQFLPTTKALCPWPQAHQGFRLLRHLGSSEVLVQQGQLLKVNFRKMEDVSRTMTTGTQVPDISGKLEMTELVNSENVAQFLVLCFACGKRAICVFKSTTLATGPKPKGNTFLGMCCPWSMIRHPRCCGNPHGAQNVMGFQFILIDGRGRLCGLWFLGLHRTTRIGRVAGWPFSLPCAFSS